MPPPPDRGVRGGLDPALLLFSQPEQFKNYSKSCSDWLEKSRPSKKATFVLIMKTGFM